jgi:DNA topoisomerase-1
MQQQASVETGNTAQLDAREAARAAKLHYTNDSEPGFSRHESARGFFYRDAKGARIVDEAVLARIRKLAIPPAYTDVWICRYQNGHIQAIGRDARGRKQYRYHPEWRAVRYEAKYGKMLLFGQRLPAIRARVERDLALPGLPREKVLAAIVRLLDRTLMRVGNEEYARANKSFGLTTLRRRHARINGSAVTFDFRAKHGIAWHAELKDRRLANIIRKLQDIPGQSLFKYIDDDDAEHGITSDDVNDYLRETAGEDITAKDFRTWAATNLAVVALKSLHVLETEAGTKKNVLRAIEAVAKMLGNTPSICRKCYIHPAIFDGYLDGSLLRGVKARADAARGAGSPGLSEDERAVTAYLKRRLRT